MGKGDGHPAAANAQIRILTIRAPHIGQGNPALRLMQQDPGFNDIQLTRLCRITKAFDKCATDRKDQLTICIGTNMGTFGHINEALFCRIITEQWRAQFIRYQTGRWPCRATVEKSKGR